MLNNDRNINYCIGESRTCSRWKACQSALQEFYAKLSAPVTSQETHGEFMAMKKRQQDDLKDVGGYFAGRLKDGIRKAGNVLGRDLITLDIDNIQPGDTNEILKRLGGLGCGWVAHSTRKHSPAAPRLRVIIPADRELKPDEYEPIARKIAHLIDPTMAVFDKTTFDVNRFMFWSSCSADSEYIFEFEDKPLISTDGILGQYDNWQDAAQWPRVPGEAEERQKRVKELGDPTEKKGVVGAFCRTYSVYDAMEKFLPGVYEPVDGQNDRYTFVAGSTAGGAVVYQNGWYLYSHHATDPAGQRACNAFDLVRLHKFCDLDDDVKPGTPINKYPSYTEMCRFAESVPEVMQLVNYERGKSVLEDFRDPVPGSTEDVAGFLGGLKSQVLTTNTIGQLLALSGIGIRYNEISREVELSGNYPGEWSHTKAISNLPVWLQDFFKLAGMKGVNKNTIHDSLDVLADIHRYNPVVIILDNTAWDGIDRFPVIYEILGLTDPFSQTLVRKWFWQTVAMAFNSDKNPVSADGVLVLQGGQGIGKTSFFRRVLIIFPGMFKEGAIIDLKNKDTVIQATSYLVAELGEIDHTTRKDQVGLKAFLTLPRDEFRSPYARTPIRPARHTSFCGTVNPGAYLVDDTGNRRFWTVRLKAVDLERLNALSENWLTQLWAQSHADYKSDPQGFRLTPQERDMLERVNAEHLTPLRYELEVLNLLDFSLPKEEWRPCQTADIAQWINAPGSANLVGRAIAKIANENPGIEKVPHRHSTVHLMPLKKVFII